MTMTTDKELKNSDGRPSLAALMSSEKVGRPSLSSMQKESSARYLEYGAAEHKQSTASADVDASAFETISKVERSWFLISNNIEKVGLTFLLNLFHEHPSLLKLFPFDGEYTLDSSGQIVMSEHMETHVKAHAAAVMRVVGTCVAGLTRMDDLVTKLRRIGSTHRQAGVQEFHYDLMYKHLIASIKDEIGPNWDQETEDAWEQAFASITDLMKRPSVRLETEPLEGWGIAMAVACLYIIILTPFRLAGFLQGHVVLGTILDILDVFAAILITIDLMIDIVQSKLKRRCVNNPFVRRLRSFVQMLEPWVPWPTNDIKVLLSYLIQCSYKPRPGISLHWTHMFGLLRVTSAVRVLHFVQCAENKALFERKLDVARQGHVRLIKLLFKLCFIIHLCACLWCIVARFELGADATEVKPSSFFPDIEILFGSKSVLNSYMRSVHWAFVNLAGIGNVESSPVTSLECFVTILTHVCGAIFYAIVTGNVIKTLEEASERESKIGTDIAKLTSYMDSARVSTTSKERILKGFMIRNVLTSSNSSASERMEEHLDLNDDVLNTLPSYLRQEVAIYTRAELIRRRDRFFSHCSGGFLVALSSSLTRTRTLLTGDYLLKYGETYEREFVLVESGSLQLQQEQETVKILERGDVIGKGWLFHSVNGSRDNDCNEYTDWCFGDRTAGFSIRALCPCTILSGLTSAREIEQLEQGYKSDFCLLGAQIRKATKTEAQRRASTMQRAAKTAQLFQSLKSFRNSATLNEINEDYSDDDENENGDKKKLN